MHLSIPDVFWVPIYYAQKDILNIEKIIVLQNCNSYNDLKSRIIKRRSMIIGVAFPDKILTRWSREEKFMKEYADSKEGVTLKIENADSDAAKQASQVDSLISQGIDVLILVPLDLFTAADLVEKAHKAGIKVVDYDRLIQNSDVDIYISFNGLKVGELQGRYLTRKVPRGNYIILSGDPKDNNSRVFKKGAMEYIKPLADKGDIKIVTDKAVDNWDRKNAFKIVEDSLIATKNRIDAILAPNDSTASGAIEALQAEGLAGKVVVTGQDADLDAAKRIVQGTQSMTVFKDTRVEALTAIDAAIKLANKNSIAVDTYINNGKTDVPSILLTPIAVDKNNMYELLIKSGYLQSKEVYNTTSK